MENKKFVIGIDFGSDSVRALVVDAATGEELATSVSFYRRWKQGDYCVPKENQYRQHPQDYIDSLTFVVTDALSRCSEEVRQNVVGLSFDTTASTPAIVDTTGTPLALLPEFAEDPDAMVVLWKDHTSIAEADEINALAHSWEVDYTKYSGGTYSCEWAWSKVLHILRRNEAIRQKAYSWVEHCDWISGLLVGNIRPETIARSRCVAGHKVMWNEEWGGLPSRAFAEKLDTKLADMRDTFSAETWEEVKALIDKNNGGFVRTKWCGELDCELAMKEKVGVSSRCMPRAQSGTTGKCPVCGKECATDIIWGVAY